MCQAINPWQYVNGNLFFLISAKFCVEIVMCCLMKEMLILLNLNHFDFIQHKFPKRSCYYNNIWVLTLNIFLRPAITFPLVAFCFGKHLYGCSPSGLITSVLVVSITSQSSALFPMRRNTGKGDAHMSTV